MKKSYVSPEIEQTLFNAAEQIATQWNPVKRGIYASSPDNSSVVEVVLPNNPEGDM